MLHSPRVLLADYPLHIVQRGINREPCFFSDEDYHCYLHWLEESPRAYYCPMTELCRSESLTEPGIAALAKGLGVRLPVTIRL